MIAVGAVLYLIDDVFNLIPPAEDTNDDPANTPSAEESNNDL